MNLAKLKTATKIFAGLVIAFCFAFIGLDLFIIFSRMFYPYQLEWMEGAGLVQVSRLLAGKAFYVPPSIDFVPLIYPPLYFYASAIIAKLIGLGFGALRLVSFLSSALCAMIIYLAVKEKTNSKFAAFLGAGCFASAFMLTGQWFDIARTDMLAAGLSMLGIYLAREPANNVTLSEAKSLKSRHPTRFTFWPNLCPCIPDQTERAWSWSRSDCLLFDFQLATRHPPDAFLRLIHRHSLWHLLAQQRRLDQLLSIHHSRRARLRFQHWQNHQRADQSIRIHSRFSDRGTFADTDFASQNIQ